MTRSTLQNDTIWNARATESFTFDIEPRDAEQNIIQWSVEDIYLDSTTTMMNQTDPFADAMGTSRSRLQVTLTAVGGWAKEGRVNDRLLGTPIALNVGELCIGCVSMLDSSDQLTLTADVQDQLIIGTVFRVLNAKSDGVRTQDCIFRSVKTSPFSPQTMTGIIQVDPNHHCTPFSSRAFDISLIIPQDWQYIGSCSVIRDSNELSRCSSTLGLERGDAIAVGKERNQVHSSRGTFDAATIPLAMSSRTLSATQVPVYRISTATGRFQVSFVPHQRELSSPGRIASSRFYTSCSNDDQVKWDAEWRISIAIL